MNQVVKNILRFLGLMVFQILVLNQIEIGFGIQLMVYPLFILLLPVEMSIILALLLAFALGLSIDVISNTYGLHASALLVFAYFRPLIFKVSAPRDGYDPMMETNLHTMGYKWFIKTFGVLLLIHHFWFFLLEIFKLNELAFVFQKTGLSVILSFLLCLLLQYLFMNKPVKK
ncbi:MAG: hypothetical protein QNL61_11855 [Crocinitomicaceae bacterium]